MSSLVNALGNLNLNSSSDDDSHSLNCSHVKLIQVTMSSYKCEQCNLKCQVTFGCSSSINESQCVQFKNSSSAIQFKDSTSSASPSSRGPQNSPENDSINSQSVTSRLLNEFDYLNVILGQGGFGSVAKFRNKKDDKIYAVKKTKANERNEREVKVLSNLHHDNIVRYYNCWTEIDDSSFPTK